MKIKKKKEKVVKKFFFSPRIRSCLKIVQIPFLREKLNDY